MENLTKKEQECYNNGYDDGYKIALMKKRDNTYNDGYNDGYFIALKNIKDFIDNEINELSIYNTEDGL